LDQVKPALASLGLDRTASAHIAGSGQSEGSRFGGYDVRPAGIAVNLEDEMIKGPFVLGENYSICDMYLFTITQWLQGDEVDVNWFPKVSALRRWMLANPVVQKVLQVQ